MISNNTTNANPLLYNITLKLSNKISDQWLSLMKTEYLPKSVDGKVIVSAQINELKVEEEEGDMTFAIQFVFATSEIYAAEGLRSLKIFVDLLDRDYKNQYVYFTTKMEILHYHAIPSHN